MKLYVVVYGSNDLTDENIEQKFGALCINLRSAKKERRRIAAETGEPTGILIFETDWEIQGSLTIDDIIDE